MPAVPGAIQGKKWGTTQCIFAANNVEVHRIFARKGGFCSIHRHVGKFNTFFVESGSLLIRTHKDGLDDETVIGAGQSTYVRPGDEHQFEALEDTWALEIYFVFLDPDDIQRSSQGGIRSP